MKELRHTLVVFVKQINARLSNALYLWSPLSLYKVYLQLVSDIWCVKIAGRIRFDVFGIRELFVMLLCVWCIWSHRLWISWNQQMYVVLERGHMRLVGKITVKNYSQWYIFSIGFQNFKTLQIYEAAAK